MLYNIRLYPGVQRNHPLLDTLCCRQLLYFMKWSIAIYVRSFTLICSTVASASLLLDMVDLENCLQEEKLFSEKLSKLFEAPTVPLSSPMMKKSHSDGIVV